MASKKGAGENVPPPKAGAKPAAINALAHAAPIMMQLNPSGEWQSRKPDDIDDRKLQEIIQHLLATKAITGENSCCSECAAQNIKWGKEGGDKQAGTNFVPIIMMPIYSTENCPFDFDGEGHEGFQQVKKQPGPALGAKTRIPKASDKRNGLVSEDEPQKKVKRQFVLQRFTDFDLMSQW